MDLPVLRPAHEPVYGDPIKVCQIQKTVIVGLGLFIFQTLVSPNGHLSRLCRLCLRQSFFCSQYLDALIENHAHSPLTCSY